MTSRPYAVRTFRHGLHTGQEGDLYLPPAARAAGDRVEYVELSGAGHMDCLEPDSEAHAILRAWLAEPARTG